MLYSLQRNSSCLSITKHKKRSHEKCFSKLKLLFKSSVRCDKHENMDQHKVQPHKLCIRILIHVLSGYFSFL